MASAKVDVQKFLDMMETDPERYKYENLLMNMMCGLKAEDLTEEERKLVQKYNKPGEHLHSEVLKFNP